MSGFLGSHLHQIDEKGRLSLPAPFRREHPDRPFVLVHAFPDSLALYPEPAWAEVEERLREMMRRRPEARAWILGVTADAAEVVPDRQGRIPLPQRLREAVGIDGEALVVGLLDRIEVWSPDRFREATASAPPDLEQFRTQIFG